MDGDTIDAEVQLGFRVSIYERFRFNGINTPESKTKNQKEKDFGLKVKEFVKELLEGKEVIIKTIKQEKFGRFLSDIFLDDGTFVNDLLVKKGYARIYKGEKRVGWFDEVD